jgi:hypothetical protein
MPDSIVDEVCVKRTVTRCGEDDDSKPPSYTDFNQGTEVHFSSQLHFTIIKRNGVLSIYRPDVSAGKASSAFTYLTVRHYSDPCNHSNVRLPVRIVLLNTTIL